MRSGYKKKADYLCSKIFRCFLLCFLIALALLNLSAVADGLAFIFSLLLPFLAAFIFAYLLFVPMRFFEKRLRISRPKKRRACAVALVYALVFAITGAMLFCVLPPTAKALLRLSDALPDAFARLQEEAIHRAPSFGVSVQNINAFFAWLNARLAELGDYFSSDVLRERLTGAGKTVFSLAFGLFLSINVLYDREKFLRGFKKITFATLKKQRALRFLHFFLYASDIFLKYVWVSLLDSAIIFGATLVFLLFFSPSYALLIAVIVGLTNLIPFFGPVLGAVPGFLILLTESLPAALWFLAFITLLQAADGNIILPKILKAHTKAPAFLIIFALCFGGGLFGVWGLVFSLPVCCVLLAWLRSAVTKKLRSRKIDPAWYE